MSAAAADDAPTSPGSSHKVVVDPLANVTDAVIHDVVRELVDDVIRSETTMPSVPDVVLDTINDVIQEGDADDPAPDYDSDEAKSSSSPARQPSSPRDTQTVTAASSAKSKSETQEVGIVLKDETKKDKSSSPGHSPRQPGSPPVTAQPDKPRSPTTDTFSINGQVMTDKPVSNGDVAKTQVPDRRSQGDGSSLSTPVAPGGHRYSKRADKGEVVTRKKESDDDGNTTLSRQVRVIQHQEYVWAFSVLEMRTIF